MVGRNPKAKCLRKQPEFSRLDKSRSFFLVGLTFLVLLLMAASIFYINTHVQVVGIGYEINQALAKKQRLIEENKKLELDIARLRSPTRIEREAKEKLDLVIPGPHQWVHLGQLSDGMPLLAKTSEPAPKAKPSHNLKTKVAKKTPVREPPKKEKPKKVLLAKIVRPTQKINNTNVRKSPTKKKSKSKESVPAVLIDPLP